MVGVSDHPYNLFKLRKLVLKVFIGKSDLSNERILHFRFRLELGYFKLKFILCHWSAIFLDKSMFCNDKFSMF